MTPKVKVLDCSYLSAASALSQVSQKQLKPPTGELDSACASKVSESGFSCFLLLLPDGSDKRACCHAGVAPYIFFVVELAESNEGNKGTGFIFLVSQGQREDALQSVDARQLELLGLDLVMVSQLMLRIAVQ